MELKAAVVGAGIGGLTAAIVLRQAGAEVTVFELATELKEVGAGLLLAANAQKALGKLGLSEKVGRLGTNAFRQARYAPSGVWFWPGYLPMSSSGR